MDPREVPSSQTRHDILRKLYSHPLHLQSRNYLFVLCSTLIDHLEDPVRARFKADMDSVQAGVPHSLQVAVLPGCNCSAPGIGRYPFHRRKSLLEMREDAHHVSRLYDKGIRVLKKDGSHAAGEQPLKRGGEGLRLPG